MEAVLVELRQQPQEHVLVLVLSLQQLHLLPLLLEILLLAVLDLQLDILYLAHHRAVAVLAEVVVVPLGGIGLLDVHGLDELR
jgi:hypothetical protein